jgi:hypothetical protein
MLQCSKDGSQMSTEAEQIHRAAATLAIAAEHKEHP